MHATTTHAHEIQAQRAYTRNDGIKVYSKLGLRAYDSLIMGAVTRYVWNCPAEVFVEYYREHITANHADIGVGTGYCLDHCGLVAGECRLALIDLQPNCLQHAAHRLARYQPEIYLRDVREQLAGIRPFASIGLGGILHCLPGDMQQKGLVFDALKPITTHGTTIFGYTLVNDAIHQRLRRRAVFRQFHRAQVINCEHDSASNLEQALALRFDDYSIEQIGCFAFFKAVVSHH
jgi:hypothetical protein